MLKLIGYILLFLLIGGRLYAQDPALPLQVEIKVTKEYEMTHHRKYYEVIYRNDHLHITKDSVKEKRFDIDLVIKNTSSKSVFFWLMSCSWEDNFMVNNNYIFIEGHECGKNIPTYVELKAGETKLCKTTLFRSIKFEYPCKNCIYGPQVETTQLGLVVINDVTKQENGDIDEYARGMEDKSKWKFFWSNPLSLLARQTELKTPQIKN